MIADYYFIRRQRLNVNELYQEIGAYTFNKGYNNAAIIALLCGIIPNIPGFLTTVKLMDVGTVWPWIAQLYNYAWFVGFAVSFFIYLFLMKKHRA